MKQILFDITDHNDINTMTKRRYGYCSITKRYLSVLQLDELAKKYSADFEIVWVYDYAQDTAVPSSFVMKMEDHMYSAFILTET